MLCNVHMIIMAMSSVGFVRERRCPSLTPWARSTETLQSEAKHPSTCIEIPRSVRSPNTNE